MVLDGPQVVLDDGTMTDDPDANVAAPDTTLEEPKQETVEQPDPSKIEVVSVTEDDLPLVETPNTLNVSPLDSFATESIAEKPEEPPIQTPAKPAPSPGMPVTKVQPFLNEDDLKTSLKDRLWAHRIELLVSVSVVIALILILGIGLGVGLSCAGKFRCGLSSKCIQSSAQCDGKFQCDNGEDELGCVRLSGRSAVLQVQRGGVWLTVCSEDWTNWLGESTCRTLGYSRYVESFFVPVSSIEPEFLSNLASIDSGQDNLVKLHNATMLSKSQCNSGKVTTLKCLECGSRPRFTTRIVGGNLSKPGQFPWQVSLHIRGEHLCGGSIITSRWIVTAAHCMDGFADPSIWGVHVGLTELPAHVAQSLNVEQIIYHAKYRRTKLDYDIALIKLRTPLVFNGLVEPICLPNHGEQFDEGTMCWISGWGLTEDGGESSIVLRSAMVPLLSTKTCSQPDVYPGLISPWMICAGYLGGGVDSCQGDSGGPLACQDSSMWKLVGATSWGIGCGDRNRPGVYTRITQSLNWIRQQMGREDVLGSHTSSSDNFRYGFHLDLEAPPPQRSQLQNEETELGQS